MFHTISYKQGYIHLSYINCALNGSIEVIRVQVDKYAYAVQVKSLNSAKRLITKHIKLK